MLFGYFALIPNIQGKKKDYRLSSFNIERNPFGRFSEVFMTLAKLACQNKLLSHRFISAVVLITKAVLMIFSPLNIFRKLRSPTYADSLKQRDVSAKQVEER